MNTIAHEEANAIAAAAAVLTGAAPDTASPYELRLIPLSRLRPSSRNVRKSGGTSIPELAASIARVGLLQNLTVVACEDGEHFEVVAGRRRLASLKLLVKRRKLAKGHPVPCLLVPDAAARTISLTENVQREAMHPADQFEAFAALVAEGRSIEDIAADFGVTPLVVQRRLRLANVSPRLLADYRADAVALDQLMALAITDDHGAQEAAFYESPQWLRSPEALRQHLTREEIDAGRDAVARFVGLDAYEAAGGGVRRDLFADHERGVFLADGGLLESLARERLLPIAEEVRGEGWAWVDVAPRATSADLHQLQRARSTRREPTKAEAKRIARLEAQQAKLQQRFDDEDEELSDEQAQALEHDMDRVEKELDAAQSALVTFPSDVLAVAGAIVTIDHEGTVVVHRGLLREQEARALKAGRRDEDEGDAESGLAAGSQETQGSGLSDKLVRRLSAHRTAALQAEVARHPEVALVALVHRLAQRLILDDYRGSPVCITAAAQDRLDEHGSDVVEAAAAKGMREVREAWVSRLPQDPEALFGVLLAMPQSEVLALLAVCIGLTVTAIASKEQESPAADLARAVGLDMHDWWTPTAEGYFAHVSKARTLEAVQAFAPDQVRRLEKLKKAELASEAERLVAGSGWLPAMLCGSAATALREEPTGAETAEGAEAEGTHEATAQP